MPHGSGLTGDRSGNTADGAGNEGLPESWTSISFPEIQPRWQYLRKRAQGEGRTMCVCGYSKGL